MKKSLNSPALIDGKYALIFHSGGYRGIETQVGDNLETSLLRQQELFAEVCRPLLENGLKVIIKTHPLCAQFHDQKHVELVIERLSCKDNRFRNVAVISDSYLPYAKNAQWIITFGSSGIYELYSLGLDRVLVLNFFGKVRSQKFSYFENAFVESSGQYKSILKNDDLILTGTNKEIFQAYESLPPYQAQWLTEE